MFGLSWNTVLRFTSMRGMVYVASARNEVRKGDSVWQNGLSRYASGTAARISHQSLVTLPVLVPPWNVKPCDPRTLMLTSTPLNTRVSSPTSLVGRIRLFTWPNTLGFTSYSPAMVWPLLGSRESVGTVTE